jgi:hypothetical protein
MFQSEVVYSDLPRTKTIEVRFDVDNLELWISSPRNSFSMSFVNSYQMKSAIKELRDYLSNIMEEIEDE